MRRLHNWLQRPKNQKPKNRHCGRPTQSGPRPTWFLWNIRQNQDARPCWMDNKASGGRRKVLRCRTALSKKKRNTTDNAEEDEDDGPNCPHMLLWTKDCRGVWTLNQQRSITHHRPFCNSGQIVTKFELLRDPAFVKT